MTRRTAILTIGAALLALTGCAMNHGYTARDSRKGLVLVLPGIEGRSLWNERIARGLIEGGVMSHVEIYDWTTQVPGNFLGNLAMLDRNRDEAAKLAKRILEYRDANPGAPIHLVGHSGGAGIAILALEALPPGRQIDMAMLLAPAISPNYDLSTALRRTRSGIINFYSEHDLSLQVGTSVFGTIDRNTGPSAGAIGFDRPADLDDANSRLYDKRLRQVRWTRRLKSRGADGTHVGWATRTFAREYLAPMIIANESREALDRWLTSDKVAADSEEPEVSAE
ncbi:MAG: alpha/beta fold hydrolase [Phycisphaerales bacterium]|nr:alpha/beta fold hydrolase [Phycisphaerales bacterium]